MPGLTGWHLLVLVLVILLLFGAAKLPALAKSMGQSARVFKGEMKAMREEDGKPDQPVAEPMSPTAASQPGTPPTTDGNSTNP